MKRRPAQAGQVLDGVDWTRWSVILLKPDCVRRNLTDTVLKRIGRFAEIVHTQLVVVEDWQVFVHYWDMLVDQDWFDVDVPACLRRAYVGQTVMVALARGPEGIDTPTRLRGLLGHFDPAQAAKGTIRADFGVDSLEAARADHRLIENLVHTSDDGAATCRDFGTWFGADQFERLFPRDDTGAVGRALVPQPSQPT
ncbi:nucleoside-diphosphate kinase [Kitasatospora atroaurantiaca]|uniref:nucleoside-diphosphate kinase n=1 Tax=Kitasatospora atroaurantiaca TaxID=285545 RepID=A0A561EN24_9ACTN|nr:nucleoside-diphosphate kinase [Kitasatospora atroaurantiaca]TWE16982.1 nucleoside diphosphate kinase [Kitasatospora atroaurantiaca]